jgi:DNA replicative helicase MCM subunit Mcm2 (Cdc46/Mcm family)
VADIEEAAPGSAVAVFGRLADAEVKTISVQVAVFRCGRCGRLAEEVQTTEQLRFPLSCSPSWGGCGAKRREAHFKLLEKESLYSERQVVELADDEREDVKLQAVLRGPLAGSVPIGAQAVFRGRLKPRSGRLARGVVPFVIEVAEVRDVRMPDQVVVYPRKVDAQVIYNIVIELQRQGLPANYRVVVDEAKKIGLAEDDVRAMLNKLLSQGKLDAQESEEARKKRRAREEEDGASP